MPIPIATFEDLRRLLKSEGAKNMPTTPFSGRVTRPPLSAIELGKMTDDQLKDMLIRSGNFYRVYRSLWAWEADQNPPPLNSMEKRKTGLCYKAWLPATGIAGNLGQVVDFGYTPDGKWKEMPVTAALHDPVGNYTSTETWVQPGTLDMTYVQAYQVMGQNARLAIGELQVNNVLKVIPQLRVVKYKETSNDVNFSGKFAQLPVAQFNPEDNPSGTGWMPVFSGQLVNPLDATGVPVLVDATEYLKWGMQFKTATPALPAGGKRYSNEQLGSLLRGEFESGASDDAIGAAARVWANQ